MSDYEFNVAILGAGCTRVMGVNKGLLHVYGEAETGRPLGAEAIGPQAEHLARLLARPIARNITGADALERPFYHPVIEEGLRSTLRDFDNKFGFGRNPPLGCIDHGPGARSSGSD